MAQVNAIYPQTTLRERMEQRAANLLAGYSLGGMGVLVDLGMVPGFTCDGFEARSVLQYG